MEGRVGVGLVSCAKLQKFCVLSSNLRVKSDERQAKVWQTCILLDIMLFYVTTLHNRSELKFALLIWLIEYMCLSSPFDNFVNNGGKGIIFMLIITFTFGFLQFIP